MRIGLSESKKNNILVAKSYHRIIIPVYVPNLTDDYFKDGKTILKYSLDSLIHTVHSKTRITLINNGSCESVYKLLESYYKECQFIDQLFHSPNIGKVNAIYSAAKTNLEPLITIADADVLYKQGWQQAVENIMIAFPNAGMVSPVPSSIAYNSSVLKSTYGKFLGKNRFKFKNVVDVSALENFQHSIGNNIYNENHLKQILTLEQNDTIATVGCGHFVATLRAEVFKFAPNEPCQFKIVGGSERTYFDEPNDAAGLLRLATYENFAYHLGNVYEDWMQKEFESILSVPNHDQTKEIPELSGKVNYLQRLLGMIFIKLIIKRVNNRIRVFKTWGLKANQY